MLCPQVSALISLDDDAGTPLGGVEQWYYAQKHAMYLMPQQPPPRFWMDAKLSGRPESEAQRLREIVAAIDADEELMQGDFIDYMKLRGLADLFFFAKYLCGHNWLTADLHGPLAWAWQAPDGWRAADGQRFDRYRLAVLARSHLKTTLLTQDAALFDAIRDVEERLLIYTHSLGFTAEVMSPMKSLLEGEGKGAELFQVCYGDRVPAPEERGKKYKWDQLNLCLKREGRYTDATIKGSAVGAKVTGTHSTKQYIDDLVGEELNRTLMEKTIKQLENLTYCYHSLKLGRRRIVGTPWGFYDPIAYSRKHWPEALVARLPWRRPSGELMFDKCDVPEALRIKKQNPWFFSCQYDVWPKDEGKNGFQREWFKSFRREDDMLFRLDADGKVTKKVALSECNTFVIIDPNTGRVPGQKVTSDMNAPTSRALDYAGFITVAVDRERYGYVLSAIRRRCNTAELVDLAFQLVAIWKPKKVIIEQRAAQILFVDLFRIAFRNGKPPFVIDDFPGGHASKEERIKGLIPMYANGLVYHREGGGAEVQEGMAALEEELCDFPNAEYDDLSDALSVYIKKCYAPGAAEPAIEDGGRDERFEESIAALDQGSRRAARAWQKRKRTSSDEFFVEG